MVRPLIMALLHEPAILWLPVPVWASSDIPSCVEPLGHASTTRSAMAAVSEPAKTLVLKCTIRSRIDILSEMKRWCGAHSAHTSDEVVLSILSSQYLT